VQNEETLQWIPASWRGKAVVAPNAIVDAHIPGRVNRSDRPPTALFAGELLPLKGITLAIRAISRAPGWHLLICGEGNDGYRLRATARRLGVEGRVRFLGQRPRNEVLRLMAEEADVLLFPSLHDEGTNGGGRSAHRRPSRRVSGSRRTPRIWGQRPRRDRASNLQGTCSSDQVGTSPGAIGSLLPGLCDGAILRHPAQPWFTGEAAGSSRRLLVRL
jgi:hypothetical protein